MLKESHHECDSEHREAERELRRRADRKTERRTEPCPPRRGQIAPDGELADDGADERSDHDADEPEEDPDDGPDRGAEHGPAGRAVASRTERAGGEVHDEREAPRAQRA